MIAKRWEGICRKNEGVHHDFITIIKALDERDKRNAIYYLCKCDCGREFKTTTDRMYKMKSCGCMKKKLIGIANTKHGGSASRLYAVWSDMKARCYNPKNRSYKHYGARGIIVCPEWKNSFKAFMDWALENNYDENADMGECTIDRIDPNGNYEPGNCRWANEKEQQNNRNNNIIIEYNGEKHTISEWSDITKIKYSVIKARYDSGWKVERMLTEPQKQILYLEYNGVRKRLTTWAKELGISRHALAARKRKGWTDAEIIEGRKTNG